MVLFTDNHAYHYEMENLCRVFFPYERIKTTRENIKDESGLYVRTALEKGEYESVITVEADIKGQKKTVSRTVKNDTAYYEKECERIMAVSLYDCLTVLSGYTPDWGILTGVRPAKLMNRLIDDMGGEKAQAYFKSKLLVSDKKTQLAFGVAQTQRSIAAQSRPESFSLYVSIPFCPTRCGYCSFVSHSMATAKKLLPEYIELICREIRSAGETAKTLGLRLETVYYGGGTPTILSAEQLSLIGGEIGKSFDLSFVREYTVEAGRPDTVTKQKLEAMKALGVSRISINPQTFNNEALKAIGRAHTVQDTLEAYELARSCGFDNINTDIIAGLPLDTIGSFANTLDTLKKLSPESVTVHTLALKRSSDFVRDDKKPDGGIAPFMLDLSYDALTQSGYLPYYMYRQTRSLGNLENVGYCKPGREGLYNIFMMEECHTVLAVGAGAVTRLREPHGAYIERVFNFKYPYEYNSRFEEILSRKEKIKEFYSQYKI